MWQDNVMFCKGYGKANLWLDVRQSQHESMLQRCEDTQSLCAMLVPLPAAVAGWEKAETGVTAVCRKKLLKGQESHSHHSTT